MVDSGREANRDVALWLAGLLILVALLVGLAGGLGLAALLEDGGLAVPPHVARGTAERLTRQALGLIPNVQLPRRHDIALGAELIGAFKALIENPVMMVV